MSAKLIFNSFRKCFDSFVLHEVNAHGSAHFLSEIKTLLISIYSTDVLDTHGTKNCNTDQTDWSASLYNNSAVETKDTSCFCSLNCMYKNCTWLDQDTGIQIKIAYVEECASEASASDENVIREPSVQMYIIIWKKSVYVSSANVLFVQVEHCDLRIILEDHTGNNFITDLNWFSSCISLNIFTHGNDLTSSLMSKCNWDQVKWVSLEFVSISTANAAAFYFNKDVVVTNWWNRVLFDVEMLFLSQNCNVCSFWDSACRCSSSWSCSWCRSCRCSSSHSSKNLFYDFFDIYVIHVHFYVSSCQRMQRLSAITQRLLLVNVLALVSPSPVRLAIVNVQ